MVDIPGMRKHELVTALRLQKGDLVVLRLEKAVPADAIAAQAAELAGRTGCPVVVLNEGYDVFALDRDLLLEAIANHDGIYLAKVSREIVPEDGTPPAGQRVTVVGFAVAENGWEVDLTLRREYLDEA